MRHFAYLREPEHSLYIQRHAADAGNRIKVQRAQDTLLNVARCPVCSFPLILRMDRRGPYFHCACTDRQPAA